MSGAAAGKFQDHYTILGVGPRANMEVIQDAYSKLAQKYHPNNAKTGDKEKFEAVDMAYETLADPGLRAEFDKLKGLDQDEGGPLFSGAAFFETLGRQTGLRAALLSVLYDRRNKKPVRPSLSIRNIDGMLDVSNDELTFALWYLKQRRLVQSDDKSNLQITVEGMDFLESKRPAPETVLPFIKPSAIGPSAIAAAAATEKPAPEKPVEAQKPAPAKAASEPAEAAESVLSVLNRALARR